MLAILNGLRHNETEAVKQSIYLIRSHNPFFALEEARFLGPFKMVLHGFSEDDSQNRGLYLDLLPAQISSPLPAVNKIPSDPISKHNSQQQTQASSPPL